ncbi:hypothetical protein GCM10027521_19510 [Amycolatopsis cihanbeyliensis]
MGDPGRPDPGEQMAQERHTGGGQHGFGRGQRERAQPGPLAADENDGIDPERGRHLHSLHPVRSYHAITQRQTVGNADDDRLEGIP